VAAPAHAITIRRAAEIFGEDEELLWDMATYIEPEHGRLWIYDTDDQQIIAFTLTDGIPAGDAPGVQTQAIISAVLSGRLR
jgi:hypothetical protein